VNKRKHAVNLQVVAITRDETGLIVAVGWRYENISTRPPRVEIFSSAVRKVKLVDSSKLYRALIDA